MKILLLLSVILASVSSLTAQDAADETKPRNVKKEIKEAYKEWLEKDVSICFARDMREEFPALKTARERDKLVEDYWFKYKREDQPIDEYYTRTAYADAHFTASVLGSKTERGYIYVLWGKPDRMQSGIRFIKGSDDGVPWQIWEYANRDFNFVDPDKTGDYRLLTKEDND